MENDGNKYKVFIKCFTFNQANYIEDAMRGFVMQKTDFPYVAVVVDDASKDGEQDVIKRFLENEFDMAVAMQDETENYVRVVAKHKTNVNCTFAILFLKYNHKSIRKPKYPYLKEWSDNAKYISLCEGDDYWTDPYKLQKQVDFLEAHEDYVLCSHKTAVKNESNRNVLFLGDSLPEGEIFPKDIFPKWTIHLSSMVYRKSAIENFHLKHSEWLESGDTVLALKCMHRGRAWAFPETMSTYRMNDFSAMSKPNDQKAIEKYCRHLKCLLLNFPKIDKDYCYCEICTYDIERFRKKDGLKNRWHYYFDAWYWAPKYMFKSCVQKLKRKSKFILKRMLNR